MYLAGGGMEGAISALREVRQPGQVSLVVNELTPDTRRVRRLGEPWMVNWVRDDPTKRAKRVKISFIIIYFPVFHIL